MASPPAWYNSPGMLSTPDDVPIFSASTAVSTFSRYIGTSPDKTTMCGIIILFSHYIQFRSQIQYKHGFDKVDLYSWSIHFVSNYIWRQITPCVTTNSATSILFQKYNFFFSLHNFSSKLHLFQSMLYKWRWSVDKNIQNPINHINRVLFVFHSYVLYTARLFSHSFFFIETFMTYAVIWKKFV